MTKSRFIACSEKLEDLACLTPGKKPAGASFTAACSNQYSSTNAYSFTTAAPCPV